MCHAIVRANIVSVAVVAGPVLRHIKLVPSAKTDYGL